MDNSKFKRDISLNLFSVMSSPGYRINVILALWKKLGSILFILQKNLYMVEKG